MLDDALWGGGLTKQQVLNKFGTDTGTDVVLDFGEDELVIIGLDDLADLKNDIDIV